MAESRVIEGPDGRLLWLTQEPTASELVRLGFEEVRQAAAPHPAVCVYVLEALQLLRESITSREAHEALEREATLVVAGSDASEALDEDKEVVRDAYRRRFAA